MRVHPFFVGFVGVLAVCSVQAFAQTGPSLSVDASAGVHAISPNIYGINFYWNLGDAKSPQRAALETAALDIRATSRR